ncbi:helix-turn-helix domain-containing protein [Cellulomonas fengjieae]|uniref:Helix-turn-helix domain-containing protein n=1 Tax=Cellulomonas fengjieae TaxID=2819978 RepID=A0ABS3SBQ1_9CELL|nr:helix-turn-helix domain-containing protein [Cellulomonas fengjieae]MBO3083175.1 helix-turn-helix domain-containing protein [Cellulomonas fengjieae]QVI65466.1 helix-turn-helix domain-containing protein [Cellulomonas fengjieae]
MSPREESLVTTSVDESGALLDAFDSEQLGARLRELREERGLTLREVGERVGVSASAVSQIERGVLRPSVNRLFALVTALDAGLVDVFGGPSVVARQSVVDGYVVRRAVEADVVRLAGGVVFRRLSPGPSRDVDFFESTYPPGSTGAEQNELLTHVGYEIGTVTHGELTIDFPDERVVVRAGDTISYACGTPHRLSNQSDGVTVATWVIVHPVA